MEGRWTILYDGRCRFCQAGAARLARYLPFGEVDLVSSHEPGALERFPGVSAEEANAAMHLRDPAGGICKGAEAVARAAASRGGLGRLANVYYIPGVRWLADRLYRVVAANRYRIAGRSDTACDTGACQR